MQALIIDFIGCPVHFARDPETGKVKHQYLADIPPNGECDIKFTRWARCYGDMIAHSVDGDFLLIALMEHERQLFEQMVNPVRISVYRLEYNMEKNEGGGKKRKV